MGGGEGIGSSPLTRGKRVCLLNDLGQVRLIPAHAGKTGFAQSTRRAAQAHPRSRGENTAYFEWSADPEGSSPLTRGKPPQGTVGRTRRGLIPAHAGKTTADADPDNLPQAHPRSRGENRSIILPLPRGLGSSPLTRGKRRGGAPPGCPAGLIPAHAGKTLSYRPRRS